MFVLSRELQDTLAVLNTLGVPTGSAHSAAVIARMPDTFSSNDAASKNASKRAYAVQRKASHERVGSP